MTKREAEALWDELRDLFVNMERTIVRIIEAEAWLPIGYPTFAAAWADRMADVRLPSQECKGAVVYECIKAGLSDDEIDATFRNVGGDTLRNVRANLADGITNVRELAKKPIHRRATDCDLPSKPYRILITVTPEERERWSDLADRCGAGLQREAEKALRSWFERMERLAA